MRFLLYFSFIGLNNFEDDCGLIVIMHDEKYIDSLFALEIPRKDFL
jgi:hypothetical protein